MLLLHVLGSVILDNQRRKPLNNTKTLVESNTMDLVLVSAALHERGEAHVLVAADKYTNPRLMAAYKAVRAKVSPTAGASVKKLWGAVVKSFSWYAAISADEAVDVDETMMEILSAKHESGELRAAATKAQLSPEFYDLVDEFLDLNTKAFAEARKSGHVTTAGIGDIFRKVKEFVDPSGVKDLRAQDLLEQLLNTGAAVINLKDSEVLKRVIEKLKKRGIGYKTLSRGNKCGIMLNHGQRGMREHPSIFDSSVD